MDYKDYYSTLGVSKSAPADDIQKAYRKLARKFHPDINQSSEAEARFKEINEAYEVLKDPEKRSKYDRFGSAWKQAQRTGAPPPGFEDIFSQFGFGGGTGGFGGGARTVEFDLGGSEFSSFFEALFGSAQGQRSTWGFGGGSQAPAPGGDSEARISLAIEEAGRGGKRELTLSDPATGRRRKLRVTIPRGVRQGQRIRLAGQGQQGPGGRRGDLYLTVDILPHPQFRLEGADLHTTLAITPWEAALGSQAMLKTLDGDVTIRIPAGSSSGQRIRLRGRGFPTAGGGNGDLFAEIKIVVPKELSSRERELFQKLAASSAFKARPA